MGDKLRNKSVTSPYQVRFEYTPKMILQKGELKQATELQKSHFLLSQNALKLLSRILNIGDNVKTLKR